jgi:microcystin degradation protein MlrC
VKQRYFCTVTKSGTPTTLVVKSKNHIRAAKLAARIVSPETNGESVKQKATCLD